MPNYKPIIRPTADIVYSDELDANVHIPDLVIHEADDGEPTGVLDQHGNQLARYSKVPMGFCR